MKNLYLFFLLAAMLTAASCNRHNQPSTNNSITDLAVSDDFDWQTSSNVNFSIKNHHQE